MRNEHLELLITTKLKAGAMLYRGASGASAVLLLLLMHHSVVGVNFIEEMIQRMEKLATAPRARYVMKTAPYLRRPKGFLDYYNYKKWFKNFQKQQEQWCGFPVQTIDVHQPDFHPADIKSWPWMVSLFVMPEKLIQLLRQLPLEEGLLQERLYGFLSMFRCGGSLLSSRFVLTAAHCLYRKEIQRLRLHQNFLIQMNNICMENGWLQPNLEGEFVCKPLEEYILNSFFDSADVTETWKVYIGTHDMRYNLSRLRTELPDDNPHMSFVTGKITPETSQNFELMGKSGFADDIALLYLEKPVQYSANARPICLPYKLEKSSECAVAGWGIGLNQITSPLDSLQQAAFSLIKDRQCEKETKDYRVMLLSDVNKVNTGKKVCAIRTDVTLPVSRSPVCKNSLRIGDSGSPLVCRYKDKRWYQVGIVSYGNLNVTDEVLPDVFTRVPAYSTWIIQTMWSFIRRSSVYDARLPVL